MKPEDRKLNLPESLTRQLDAFERRLRRVETVVTVCGALLGLLVTYGLLFLSDRVWDTPVWLRGLLTLTGVVGFGWFSFYWLNRWWFRRRNARELARLVQRSYRQLGDRLLGVVELADGEHLSEDVSPALCRAAIRQVAAETGGLDFDAAVSRRNSHRFELAFGVLLVLVIAPFVLFPRAGLNALQRWFKPFAQVERYTFVSLQDLPDRLVVPHGEPFEIVCRLAEDSSWQPEQATARYEDQPVITSQIDERQARFDIPGQTMEGMLQIRIGDAVSKIMVTPAHRPELLRLVARVTLPEYLERQPEEIDAANGMADVLEGSQVVFNGEVSRDLASIEATDWPDANIEAEAGRFTSPPISAGEREALTLTWEDTLGLTPAKPYTLTLQTSQDEAPLVECRGLTRTMAILEDEVLELDVNAEDDFGLRRLWIDWKSEGNEEKGIEPAAGSETVGEGSPVTDALEGRYAFSPLTEHVGEDSLITLSAYATDYKPGREPAASLEYKIYVLNRAQHAKLIQQRMEAMMARIEDLARNEENLMQDNLALKNLSDAEVADPATAEKLRQAEVQESRNRGDLERLAREGQDIMKEGLRNKDIPESTLREWNELTEAMQSLARNQMSQAAQALQQAAAKSQQRRENTDKATELEQEVVDRLREMEQQANESIEQMLAQNFINRLRQIATSERGIGGQLTEMMARIIGLNREDLPADDAEHIDRLATRQGVARQDAGYIQDDLAGFFNRTREDAYHTVYQEMVGLDTTGQLDELAGLIARNVGGQSIARARTWEEQFNQWADFLEENGGGGGSGQGECEQAQVDLETLLALIRARQREETMREQTRRLETSREANRRYITDARKLAASQFDLGNEMGLLERKVDDDRVKLLISKVGGEMMNAGTLLRRPRTDQETIGIQTEIIELLSMAMKNCSGSKSAAGQALLAMMGMGGGSSGSGNPGGGDTNRANLAAAGGTGGGAGEERAVRKTGGLDPSAFPAEFRDVLEGYYNGLEELRP